MGDLMDISARIYMLSTEEGGRWTPIFSGYRPALYFGERQTDGAITLHGCERVMPGKQCQVSIRLLHPEHLGHALKPNATFALKEGLRVVGWGTVLKVDLTNANIREETGCTRQKAPGNGAGIGPSG